MSKLGALFAGAFLGLGFYFVLRYDLWPEFAMWFCFTFAHNIADHKRRK